MTPWYIQWTIPSLLYHIRRKNQSEYKGLSMQVQLSSGAMGKNSDLNFHLRPYCVCVCVSNKGSDKSAHLPRIGRALAAHICNKYQNLMYCTIKPVLSGHSKRRPKLVFKYVLKRVSLISKDCTKELKLECAYFLGQTSKFLPFKLHQWPSNSFKVPQWNPWYQRTRK